MTFDKKNPAHLTGIANLADRFTQDTRHLHGDPLQRVDTIIRFGIETAIRGEYPEMCSAAVLASLIECELTADNVRSKEMNDKFFHVEDLIAQGRLLDAGQQLAELAERYGEHDKHVRHLRQEMSAAKTEVSHVPDHRF